MSKHLKYLTLMSTGSKNSYSGSWAGLQAGGQGSAWWAVGSCLRPHWVSQLEGVQALDPEIPESGVEALGL